MPFRRRAFDRTYLQSQSVTTVPAPPATATALVQSVLDCSDDHKERMRAAQALLDALSDNAGLPHVRVVVADRAQVHEHDGQRLQSKTYGYYTCEFGNNGAVEKPRIRIYHRTAVRQQIITTKVFLNTLLHEWVHHYDFAGLRFERSPHTAGFYARLRSLADAVDAGFVLPPDADDQQKPVKAARTQTIAPAEPVVAEAVVAVTSTVEAALPAPEIRQMELLTLPPRDS